MTLELTAAEQELLLETLISYLSNLRIEIMRTDNREFKARLRRRMEVAETVLDKLRSR